MRLNKHNHIDSRMLVAGTSIPLTNSHPADYLSCIVYRCAAWSWSWTSLTKKQWRWFLISLTWSRPQNLLSTSSEPGFWHTRKKVPLAKCFLSLFCLSIDTTKLGIKMEIVFKRRLTNELLTTYLPTFLLLGITYATTFFKPFFFEAALTVNLTVM